MTSAYLESDSDSGPGQLSDSSDTELPPCDIRSSEQIPRVSGAQDVSFWPVSGRLCPVSAPNSRPQDSYPHKPQEGSSPVSRTHFPVSVPNSSPFLQPHKSFPSPAKVLQPSIPKTPEKQHGYSIVSGPSCSKDTLSQVTLSPSPNKLVDRHEKSLHYQRKLANKVEKLTTGIRSRNEKTSKLEEYRSAGGIFGLSRNLDERVRSTSSEGDGDEESNDNEFWVSKQQRQAYSESNRFPFPLSAPGCPIFVHPPELISELYPPGYHKVEGEGPIADLEKNLMQQMNPHVLHQLICERWFLLTYRTKPCPTCIWEWLFQIMCLSCDQQLAQMAFINLKTLVEWAHESSVVHVPKPCTVVEVMVSLGADRDQLEAKTVDHVTTTEPRTVDHVTTTEPSDDVFPSSFMEVVCSRLSNLCRYISLVVSANPSSLPPDQIHHLFFMFSKVSLDSSLTKGPPVLTSIAECLSSLVSAIPELSWTDSLSVLSTQLTDLSAHHHNLLHLNKMVSPVSPRMRQLLKIVCKMSIWKLLFPGTIPSPKERVDRSFAWKIIQHYYTTPSSQFEYYSMYSVMCLFSNFMNMSVFEWPSEQMKREFKSMLSTLGSVKIKDTVDNIERAPVKDVFIRMSLEIATQKSRDSKQTNLFPSTHT